MLGFYERFPATLHAEFTFTSLVSSKKLELALIQTLTQLNKESTALDEVAIPTIPQCQAVFEFGVAAGNDFSFLDPNEEKKMRVAISKTPLDVIDFLCDIRYHRYQNGKRRSLRFDYFLIRFKFHQKQGEIQIFHEKGPRYVTPEDLAALIVKKLNENSGRRILTAP